MEMRLFTVLPGDGVLAGALFKGRLAIDAAEGNRAILGTQAIDGAGGLAVHGTLVVDGPFGLHGGGGSEEDQHCGQYRLHDWSKNGCASCEPAGYPFNASSVLFIGDAKVCPRKRKGCTTAAVNSTDLTRRT